MNAKSIKGKSVEEIKSALEQSMTDGFKPTLSIVFISIKQNRKAVTDLLLQHEIDFLGATSCGEFINGYQSEGETVILLLDISKDAYTILFEEINDNSIYDIAADLALKAVQSFANPSLIVCSTGINLRGEYFDGELLVNGLKKSLSADSIFFGGMAGDDMTFTGTYVFTQHKETTTGIVALVLDANKISLTGMATIGWKPMGISRIVTKSVGNRLYSIDQRPAVEMYLKYLGKEENKNDKAFNIFEELGFTYPFIVERESGGETVLRAPLKIDHKENALVLDIEMPEGTKFWFSMPPDFDIVDEILHEALQFKNTTTAEADALLIFSCAGRSPVLGPLATEENNGLAKVWNTPMVGFFTYGEYGRTKLGRQEFHSGACCWVALKEK